MSRRRFETGARARFGLAVLLVLFAPAAASASGLVVIDRPPPGWRPPPHVPHAFAPLELRRHHVTVSVAGQVATTRVEQTFFNPNDRPLEGTYLFPVPRGAKLDGFAMDIDGRLTEAELLDAAKARKIYEDIVRSLKDPALFEYAGQDLFKVRIFPLEPRKEKRVKLEYTQLLTADGGLIEYRLPLAPGKFSARPIESVSVTVRLDADEPLATIHSPSHAVEVKRDGDRKAVVGFEARDSRPAADFQLIWGVEPTDDVGLRRRPRAGRGLREGLQADRGHRDRRRPRPGPEAGRGRFTLSRSFAEQDEGRDFLPRLWAARRVGFLLDQIRLHGESQELRDEAATLARRYGIVTPYTSWLILEDEGRRSVAAADRTLQALEADREARDQAGRMFAAARDSASGAGAVSDAQAYDTLRRAEQLAAPAAANAKSWRGQAGEKAGGAAAVQRAVERQQTQTIAGRTFYANAGQWIDARVQERPRAKREKIPFGSDAYFALLDRDPAVAQWLALGRNVIVLVGDTVVEVVE